MENYGISWNYVGKVSGTVNLLTFLILEKCDFKNLRSELRTDRVNCNLEVASGTTCEVLENIYQASYSEEWQDFFDQYNSINGIQVSFTSLNNSQSINISALDKQYNQTNYFPILLDKSSCKHFRCNVNII